MKTPWRSVLLAILVGGFVAGTIDIGSAVLINSLSPMIILHAIASGLLGAASFHGGVSTAILGLILQWAMSWLIAAVYVAGAYKFADLNRRWVASGIIYGVIIFGVMNYVVVPLSAAPFKHQHFGPAKFIDNLLAMILFGLIVAFFARVASRHAQPYPLNSQTP